ncbi:MAG: molybdopterin-dependent oxidoreductase [Syntrophaceae bacterium]|nr:molybdopterin-dependent oxidoreductase [Syntrophaceae bacterium]
MSIEKKTTMQENHYGTCPLCESECGIEITVENNEIVSIKGDKSNPFSKGNICPKAVSLIDLYNDPDRLRYPVRRTERGWERIDWKDAFDEIGEKINDIRRCYGKDAVALFLGNPNVHYHGNLLYLGFLLRALNTKNRYSSSSLDQLPLMMTCHMMFGHQILFPVPDIDRTDYFIIIGGNPAISGGSIMTTGGAIQRIKNIRQRNGTVVVIDPVFTKTASLANRHYFIRPGTDAFLVAAMVNTVFEEDLCKLGRLNTFLDGAETVREAVQPFTAETVSKITGISANDIRTITREFCAAQKAVCYGRIGTCVQEHGTVTTWLIIVLNTLTGNMDRSGGSMFTTPALDLVGFTALAGEKGWFGRHRTRVSGLPDFSGDFPVVALPEEILTPGEGKIRALISIAGNPVISAPNGRLMDEALGQLDYMVAIDWYINETSRHAHIILPPTTILEHHNFTMMTNLAGVRNFAAYSKPILAKQPGTLDNWEIILELTARFLANPLLRFAVRFLKPEFILNFLLRFGPHGSGLKIWRSGLTLAKVAEAEHGIDLGPLVPRLPERLFTKNKRISLAPEMLVKALNELKTVIEENAPKRPDGLNLLLISRRNLLSNNSWFHNFRRMHTPANRCTLMVHPSDAKAKQIKSGNMVRVVSGTGNITLEAEVTDSIMPGVVCMPHGWGHNLPGVKLSVALENPGVNINDIIDNHRFDFSGTAVFSGVPVRIEKITLNVEHRT